MKLSQLAYLLLIFITVSCNKKSTQENSTEAEDAHSWTETDMISFQSNCIGFLENEGVANPSNYCDCLLESSLLKYPDVEEAMELEQHEIVSMFENSDCIDELLLVKIEQPWTEESEELFMKSCQDSKKSQGSTGEQALEYCDCALEEVKLIIPNPQHVISLTEEELERVFNKCG